MRIMNLRSKIASLRDAKDMTQLELALAVGVTETTIANWEKGRSGLPIILQLIKMCRVLDCNLEDLVDVVCPESVPDINSIRDLSLSDLHSILGIKNTTQPGAASKRAP